MENKNERKCKQCGKTHDIKEVTRIYGKDSMVLLLGYCSAQCYTKSRTQ